MATEITHRTDALAQRIAQLEADRALLVRKVEHHEAQAQSFRLAIQDRDDVLQALRGIDDDRPVIVTPFLITH